jgi:hypothetical protein
MMFVFSPTCFLDFFLSLLLGRAEPLRFGADSCAVPIAARFRPDDVALVCQFEEIRLLDIALLFLLLVRSID